MLDSLRGRVLSTSLDAVVVECSGVAFRMKVPPGTGRSLRTGEEGRLYTHLLMRDEQFHLFGFVEEPERDLFLALLSVSGMGPEKARLILGTLKPYQVAAAVDREDARSFQVVKGVGARLAQKLVIELSGKLDRFRTAGAEAPTAASSLATPQQDDLIAALQQLGYTRTNAEVAANKALKECEPTSELETLIKSALRILHAGG